MLKDLLEQLLVDRREVVHGDDRQHL